MTDFATAAVQADATAAAFERMNQTLEVLGGTQLFALQVLQQMNAALNKTPSEAEKAEKALEAVAKKAEESAKRARDIFARGFGLGGLSSELKEIRESFKLAGDSSLSAGDRIRAGLGAVGQTFQLLRGGVDSVREVAGAFVEAAAAGERHDRALSRLGPAYAQVQAATNGAVSAEAALRAQQSLSQSGLQLTGRELAVVARQARDYALATGTETTQALDQLVDALRGGEAEGLRRFGLSADSTKTRADNLSDAIVQMTTKTLGVAPAAQTTEEAYAALQRTWEESKNATAAAVASGLDLVGTLNSVASAAAGAAAWYREYLDAIVTGGQPVSKGRGVGDAMAEDRRNAVRGQQELSGEGAGSTTQGFGGGDVSLSGQTSLGAGVGDAAFNFTAFINSDPRLGRAYRQNNVRRGGGGGGGGGGFDEAAATEAQARLEELLDKARRAGIQVEELNQRAGQRLDSYMAEEASALLYQLGSSADRVIRHRGESLEAFTARQISAAESAVDKQLSLLNTLDERIEEERAAEQRFVDKQNELARQQSELLTARSDSFRDLVSPSSSRVADARFQEETMRQLRTGQRSQGDLEGQIRQLRTQALDPAVSDREAEQLQRKAEMLRSLTEQWEAYNYEQEKANDLSRQLGDGFEQFFNTSKTAAQSATGLMTGSLQVLGGALENTIGALLDGEQITAQVMQKTAHEVTKKVALMALAEGVLELGRGTAKVAASYGTDPTAYGHFAAAGIELGLAATFGLAAYATRDVRPGGGAGSFGGGARQPASLQGNGAQDRGSVVNLTINYDSRGRTFDTAENVHDAIVGAVNEAARRNNWVTVSPVRRSVG